MSSNLYGSGGSSSGTVGGLSPRPSINDTFGLRQRNVVHSKLSASDNNNTSNIETENSHPNNHNPLYNNNNKNSAQSYDKWGSSISNVRAPPRMSLASCSVGGKKYGTPNRNNVASASSSNQQQKTNNIKMNTSNNRTAYQSSAIVSLETPNYKSTKIIEYKSKIRTEADIMLYPDEYDEVYTTNGLSTLDSLCERLLGWFFFWDTSQSY